MEAFLRSVNVLDRSVMVAEGKIYQVKETSLARESFDVRHTHSVPLQAHFR